MSVLVERKRPTVELGRPHKGRLLDIAAIGVPTLLGLILCLYDLNTRSLWLDEAASITIASQHGAALGAAMAHDGGNMLGYYGFLHLLIGVFGNGSLGVRLPSALAAGATIALTSLIALRLWDRRVAAVCGALGAVSLPLVYWGQDARGYEAMIAFICASVLLLVLALQRPKPGWKLWLGFVVVTTAAVYMGLEAVLVCPAELLALFWFRRHSRWVLSALAASAACCIPLAILASSRGSSQIFWIPAPNPFTTRQVLLTLSSAGLEPQFYSSTGESLLRLTEVLSILAGCGLVWLLLQPRTRGQAWKPTLIGAWLLVPVLLSWAISELGHPMFEARYLLMCLPAVALVLGWLIVGLAEPVPAAVRTGLAGVKRWRPPRLLGPAITIGLRVLAVGLLVALLTLRAIQLAPSYGVSTEPWRAVTKQILASFRVGDCVAFYPLDSRMPFRYYLPAGTPAPRSVLPAVPWSNGSPFVENYSTLTPGQLTRVSRQCNRVWLVSGHQGSRHSTPVGTAHFLRYQDLVGRLDKLYANSTSRTYGAARILTVTLFGDSEARPGRRSGSAAF